MSADTGVFFQHMVSPGEADVCLLGIPWDGTVTNRPGTRFGPEALRSATFGVEDYSPYQDRDLADHRYHDAGDLELPYGDAAAAMVRIRENYRELAAFGHPIIALGGEHLVTLPMVQVQHERHNGRLAVVHLDAHTDRRTDYLGVALNHSTVIHHIEELVGVDSVVSIGLRSGTGEEWKRLRAGSHLFGGIGGAPIDSFSAYVRENLRDAAVYLTVDLDVFDPGILPGTGTPEPGGIHFADFITIVRALGHCDIIGGDIVELAPAYDPSGISAALAATVLRELILLVTGN